MNCYINTFYEFNNYGTKLQNYALLKTFEKYNYEVETIYINDYQNISKNIYKHILSIIPAITEKQKVWKNEIKKKNAFRAFDKQLHYKKISYSKLTKTQFNDSIAIVGSDQVWSPEHLIKHKKDFDLFFLKYIEKNKRFCYAPSFGVSCIPNELKSKYADSVNDLCMISTREEQGKKILQELTQKEVTVVPDPVFLLTRAEWSCINSVQLKQQKYVFIYFLDVIKDNVWNKINAFAKKHNYKIVNIAGNTFDKKKNIISPDLFVKYIENSICVFTDSFHAATFSIIMERPFIVFERFDVKQSSRIENILDKFECDTNYVRKKDIETDDFIIDPIYNESSKRILDRERNIGLNYIHKMIRVGEE